VIALTVTVIRHKSELWRKAQEEFKFEEEVGDKEFGHWLRQEENSMRWNNTIEMFLWFAKEVRGIA
jgi:hypothetical protein